VMEWIWPFLAGVVVGATIVLIVEIWWFRRGPPGGNIKGGG
jgi:hypothetical protein